MCQKPRRHIPVPWHMQTNWLVNICCLFVCCLFVCSLFVCSFVVCLLFVCSFVVCLFVYLCLFAVNGCYYFTQIHSGIQLASYGTELRLEDNTPW